MFLAAAAPDGRCRSNARSHSSPAAHPGSESIVPDRSDSKCLVAQIYYAMTQRRFIRRQGLLDQSQSGEQTSAGEPRRRTNFVVHLSVACSRQGVTAPREPILTPREKQAAPLEHDPCTSEVIADEQAAVGHLAGRKEGLSPRTCLAVADRDLTAVLQPDCRARVVGMCLAALEVAHDHVVKISKCGFHG